MSRYTPYRSTARLYEDYYCNQVGNGLPVFIGGRNYTGHGIGNLLGGIGRAIVPLLRSGGKALLKEGARTGIRVARDVLSGQNIESSLKQRANQAGKRLFQQAVGHVMGEPSREPPRKRIKPSTLPRGSQKTTFQRQQKKKKKKKKTKGRKTTSVRDIFG